MNKYAIGILNLWLVLPTKYTKINVQKWKWFYRMFCITVRHDIQCSTAFSQIMHIMPWTVIYSKQQLIYIIEQQIFYDGVISHLQDIL